MFAFRNFQVNWKAKSIGYAVLDRMPLGREAYYLMQTRVTGTVPRALSPTVSSARWNLENVQIMREAAGAAGLRSLSTFEFGAGWDLFGPCVAWCLGAEHQTVYDLTRWARARQINVVLQHLRKDPPPGAMRLPEVTLPDHGRFEEPLLKAYGIDYRAPADAGATHLADGSIDVVTTTSVLEHIPPQQIARLLKECHRILRPGGLMSHVIDYSDHSVDHAIQLPGLRGRRMAAPQPRHPLPEPASPPGLHPALRAGRVPGPFLPLRAAGRRRADDRQRSTGPLISGASSRRAGSGGRTSCSGADLMC